ncbi:WSC domain-containing protein 2, partial [Termitomyces sp. J132]
TRYYRRQNLAIPTVLPGNWTSQGCYTDLVNNTRTLGAAQTAGSGNNASSCIAFCNAKGFVYAGTEFSVRFYCDNQLHFGIPAPATDCNMACSGNPLEQCGAGGRLNLYWSGIPPPPPPSTAPKIGNWSSLGCYKDNVAGLGRSLTVGMAVTNNSNEVCTAACFEAGYPLSGTEFTDLAVQLIVHGLDCGNTIANGGVPAAASDCNMLCAGNTEEFCGGPNRLNVYNYTGTDLPLQNPGNGNSGSVFPVTSGLSGNFSYAGCYVDNAFGRILVFSQGGNPNNTIQSCVTTCASQNYIIAGTEFADCGNTLVEDALIAADSTCNMGCAGNTTQACGGPNRVSVYTSTGNVTVLPVPSPLQTGLPTNWKYKGCLREPANGAKALPYKIVWPTNNTALACVEQCAAFGYPASGVEFGQECYCGDQMDPVTNSAIFGAESECNLPCPGDPVSLCGAGNRLNYYEYNGTMNLWNTPDNIGQYEVSEYIVVVPLIATLGINNKVTFLEKAGTGFPNSTGAYELDLTLVSNFSATWREMHVKSDVFCAGSVILPDKAGRQINVGGWSLESTFGLRLYAPSGSDGVNGTTDWEEDYPALSLQRGRWYPTAAILSNGSVLVIGGETGSNASPQPNLEILPKPPGGDTVVELDWLARTDPNNLYPFVLVLPSKRLFVGYWNEARILDPVTFDTYKVLPNIPGAVNDFLAGRTYPLEASSSTHGNSMGARTIFPAFTCSGTTCTITAPPNSGVSPPAWHQLFILDGPTPSHSKWVRIGGDPAQLGNWPDIPGFTLPGV